MSNLKGLAVSHIALPCRDPESIIDWYVQTLGFARHGSQLWSNGTVITILQGTPLPSQDFHFGFRVALREDVAEWHRKLTALGAVCTEPGGNEYYSSFYFEDPEKNSLEIFWEEPPN